ncbi:MAG: hypothetical protein QHH02_02905 [Syntrophomonadaceae bacterium]|nr:hypothetical protein [Syntrophomonadaceae bacterium]
MLIMLLTAVFIAATASSLSGETSAPAAVYFSVSTNTLTVTGYDLAANPSTVPPTPYSVSVSRTAATDYTVSSTRIFKIEGNPAYKLWTTADLTGFGWSAASASSDPSQGKFSVQYSYTDDLGFQITGDVLQSSQENPFVTNPANVAIPVGTYGGTLRFRFGPLGDLDSTLTGNKSFTITWNALSI